MDAAPRQYHSPTHGLLTEPMLIERIRNFVLDERDKAYRLIVGTDSLPNGGGQVYLVTAVVLHRIGRGGIYFWHRQLTNPMVTLRERMYAEALASIAMAQRLDTDAILQPLLTENIEIHVDVGQSGPTRTMIQELVGMIIAHGYSAKVKPDSFAASAVADRHTIIGPRLVPVPVRAVS